MYTYILKAILYSIRLCADKTCDTNIARLELLSRVWQRTVVHCKKYMNVRYPQV